MSGIPAHYPQIVRIRIREMCQQRPHYENSYYGPIDKVLNTVFSDPHFLTKPQARLRKEEETMPGVLLPQRELDAVAPIVVADGDANEDDIEQGNDEGDDAEGNDDQGGGGDNDDEIDFADTSADSYDILVAAGLSQSKVPDFVVCFSRGHIGLDTIRLVIEIKRHNELAHSALAQLQDYLRQAESRSRPHDAHPRLYSPRLHGVLILQDNVRICQKVNRHYKVVQSWKLNGRRFYQWLESVANEDLDNPEYVRMDMATRRWMNVLW